MRVGSAFEIEALPGLLFGRDAPAHFNTRKAYAHALTMPVVGACSADQKRTAP